MSLIIKYMHDNYKSIVQFSTTSQIHYTGSPYYNSKYFRVMNFPHYIGTKSVSTNTI